ncbi:SWIM zinc finger family protein [Dactylosporangium sp. CA-233914]|uniref:SWIM zinc finger family protein n=1 Tax=Dactylosporangium sp. CA-233914 TaxID=3239934 RepID=UPI003D8FE381
MAWFTEVDLEDLAGGRSFSRGQGYVEAVSNLRDLPDGVVATVRGTDPYQVRLYDTDGGLDGECNCPYGEEGNFCKHCVAVGLRLLDRERATGNVRTNTATDIDVRAFIASLGHDELVDLVWQQTSDDPAMYQRMLLRAMANAATVDLGLLAEQVERLEIDWINYGEEDGYAEGADAVIEALAALVPDRATEVQPLLRRTFCLVCQAAQRSEDHSGAAIDSAGAAWDAYLQACETDPPNPAELGEWFAEFRLGAPDGLEVSITDIADLLGVEGLNAYWAVLETAKTTKPSDWTVRMLREELIRATGDLDALVACYAEDLSSPQRYVDIARLLLNDGRTAEAIEWLERGRAGVDRWDHRASGLADLLVELYTEAGRTDDVIALWQARFHSEGSVETYRVLRAAILAADPGRWPEQREQAWSLLRHRADDSSLWSAGDVYVRVLLLEDEDEAAWEAVGRYRCDQQTRLAVTDRRSATHPAEALAIYLPIIETAVAQTNTMGYEQAADLLVTLRGVFARAGRDFEAEMARLKAVHSRKRNFLGALRQRGL